MLDRVKHNVRTLERRKRQERASLGRLGAVDHLQRPVPRRVHSVHCSEQSTLLLHGLELPFDQSEAREGCHMAPIDTGL